jgi:CRP-like cAMP-binding protein
MNNTKKSTQLFKIFKDALLNNDIIENILKDFVPVKFLRNQIIQDKGEIGKYLYFLEKGIIRHYYAKENKEFTAWFSKEGDFVANAGFFTQMPVNEIIVALEDIEAYSLSYCNFEKHCVLSHELERFVRNSLAEQLFLFDKYNSDTFLLTAAERCQNFLEQFPDLILRVPLLNIASFLRMTPETLSRVRSIR